MEFLRLGPWGRERPCVRDDNGEVYDLTTVTDDIDGGFLGAHGIQRAHEALERGQLARFDATGLRTGSPVRRPGAVLCIGQNYAAHAAETGDAPPSKPILFLKHPNTVVGPDDDVIIPPGAEKVDWEVELAVVIGRRARYLASPDESASVVAGYTISNDVTERHYQFEESLGQWSKGKCCETFNPLGPVLVPANAVDEQNLRLWSTVNGAPRQDSTTEDMVFTVNELVWHLSQFVVLEPGDIINTGTPQGVALSGRYPYLVAGDEMEIGIDGLGVQHQRLVTASLDNKEESDG